MRQEILLEFFLLLVLPMLLVRLLPLEESNFIIIPFGLLIAARTLWLMKDREITVVILGKGWGWYALSALFGCAFFWFFEEQLYMPEWLTDWEPLSFTLLHTLMQEVVFRVYLLNRLKKFGLGFWSAAFANGLAFGLVHGVLPDSLWIMLLTFGAGFVWSVIYQKNPNLLGVWVSHAAVNKFLNVVT